MSKTTGTTEGRLYVMPKVSVVIQKGGFSPVGAYSYSYREYTERPPRSVFGLITAGFTWVIGFFLAIVLFAIPVAITSVVLVNTMSSQGVVTIKNQYVPSDGTKRYVEETPQMIIPADR